MCVCVACAPVELATQNVFKQGTTVLSVCVQQQQLQLLASPSLPHSPDPLNIVCHCLIVRPATKTHVTRYSSKQFSKLATATTTARSNPATAATSRHQQQLLPVRRRCRQQFWCTRPKCTARRAACWSLQQVALSWRKARHSCREALPGRRQWRRQRCK